jgi:putative glutamine amidotransferase
VQRPVGKDMKKLSRCPVIGITSSMEHADRKRKFPTAYAFDYLKRSYYEAVEKSGGIAVALPNTKKLDLTDDLLSLVDGLLISGGNDVDPAFYGEKKKAGNLSVTRERDIFEIELVRKAKDGNIPMLAICRGMQLVNVAFGGSLHQDFRSEPSFSDHTLQGSTIYKRRHRVVIRERSRLFGAIGKTRVLVNTSHHQMIKRVARGFVVTAKSEEDGVIEGIEPETDHPMLCVQWHPELMRDKGSRALFDWLAKSAGKHRRAKSGS